MRGVLQVGFTLLSHRAEKSELDSRFFGCSSLELMQCHPSAPTLGSIQVDRVGSDAIHGLPRILVGRQGQKAINPLQRCPRHEPSKRIRSFDHGRPSEVWHMSGSPSGL